MIDRLKTYGIGGKLIGWFNSYLTGRQQRVVLDGIYSNWLDVTSGVPQGSILGPLLFLVYTDEMPNYLRNDSKLALFADDSKLYSHISNATDSERLQNDMILLTGFNKDSNMELNISKCKVLSISRKREKEIRSYKLNSSLLESVSEFTDLGIKVTNNLSWNKHIEEIVLKANRKLGLIRRICKENSDIHTSKLLYCTPVRPNLEYVCELWSSSISKHKLLIKNVQRCATRFTLA